MGDEEQRAVPPQQEFLEPRDPVDVQVVGGLVEKQQVRVAHQGAGEQHPSRHSSREARERD